MHYLIFERHGSISRGTVSGVAVKATALRWDDRRQRSCGGAEQGRPELSDDVMAEFEVLKDEP